MRKIIIMVAIALLVIIVVLIAIWIFSNPLRKPNEVIREKLLSEIPLGSHKGDVLEYIMRNEKWSIVYTTKGNIDFDEEPEDMRFITVAVNIGSYRGAYFFKTDVVALWIFTDNDKLRGIRVRKHTDSL